MKADGMEMNAMKRSIFGTTWFAMGMLGAIILATAMTTVAVHSRSIALFGYAFIYGALAVSYGVMIFAPQENRLMRLVPLMLFGVVTVYYFAASSKMTDALYTFLLARGIPKTLLDIYAGKPVTNLPSPDEVALAIQKIKANQIFVGQYVIFSRPQMALMFNVFASLGTIGTWFSHETAISGWLTPFYVPKAPKVVVNNYYQSPY